MPFSADADVYLVNTCTVTGTGDQKSLKTIRRAARLHPDSAILVCGCLAQREAESIARMDNVRLVLGVQRRAEAVELLERALAENTTINAVAPLRGAGFEKLFVSRHEGKTRATMKIQEGCDRYCAYCIIPTVRGPVRSMPLNDVKAEAKRLADSGYREIVLTGIHLASYGRGTDDALIDAIRAVHDTPGVARVRLGSLEPKIADEAFARALSELPGLARQFHLSLQSGSAGVLKRMRRRYTPEEYLAACETLRRWMPGCAVTTDIIAGFPGETEAEFAGDAGLRARGRASPASMCSPIPAAPAPRPTAWTARFPRRSSTSARQNFMALGNQLERELRLIIWWEHGAGPCCSRQPAGEAAGGGLHRRVRARARANAQPGSALIRVRIRPRGRTRWRVGEADDRRREVNSHGLPVLQDHRRERSRAPRCTRTNTVFAFRDINPQAPVHVLAPCRRSTWRNILECDARDRTGAVAAAVGRASPVRRAWPWPASAW